MKSFPIKVRAGLLWLFGMAIISVLCLTLFAVGQHVLRQSANDPQIQASEEVAAALTTGVNPTSLIPATPMDVAHDLAVFIIMFDPKGQVVLSSGSLDGKTPVPPPGVFHFVSTNKRQDRFTWMPKPGVRIAAVVTGIRDGAGGFVLAGRSLREVEARADDLLKIVAVAWLICGMLLSAIIGLVFSDVKKIRK